VAKLKLFLFTCLVAFAFLGKPPTPYGRKKGCTLVDHKDENKHNCCADNLQWFSRQENNTKHPYQRRPKNTPEQQEAARERHRIANSKYYARQREKQKAVKIEESDN
jgi:hypothetical protein